MKKRESVKNPIEAIASEVDKAKKAPKKVGLLSIKKANDWVDDAMARPNPRTFCRDLIVEYETTVVFAASNVGKSIFVTQMAEEIAWKEKVLYLDLELADKQFQMRYTDPEASLIHRFPDNFLRAEITPELITGTNLEEEILASIEEAAKTGIKFFVVDNITFICNDSEKGATAGEFMMKLIKLKKQYGLTTIIIAHTPKRRQFEPITQNDLAGSAKLINFFDAGIAIARSVQDPNIRYVKQVKVRTGEYRYDGDNVMLYDVNKTEGCLRFEFQGYGKEEDHLCKRKDHDDTDEIIDVLLLQKEGKSIREIAKALGMSKGKVERRLEKAKKEGITLPPDEPAVPAVSPVSDTEKSGQPRQQEDKTLFEEEDSL